MYSPAPMENAPARRPANPAITTTSSASPEPATPKISERLDTRPSFIPKIAARRAPDLLLDASCSRPTGPGCGTIREVIPHTVDGGGSTPITPPRIASTVGVSGRKGAFDAERAHATHRTDGARGRRAARRNL